MTPQTSVVLLVQMDHKVLQHLLRSLHTQSHMQKSNGELHLVFVLHMLVTHQVTSHTQIQLQHQPSWVRQSKLLTESLLLTTTQRWQVHTQLE